MEERRPRSPREEFSFADTAAARMLKDGLDRQKTKGVSLRSIAKRLHYAQATVLSHMANGRVGIPIERATEIAREVGLDQREFLAAAVAQRAPEAQVLLAGVPTGNFGLVAELAMVAGGSLDELSDEQKSVMREVAADPRPARRWLSIAELPAVNLIREARPHVRQHGLSSADMNLIGALLDLDP